jgi:holo-[acyl-carrier protein] synthase
MAIVGTGIDITEVPRIAASIARFGDRFLNRVYTPKEIAYCKSKSKHGSAQSFAARFAAKEAAMKAIGTGLRRGVTWHDVEVAREPSGRPTIIFSGKAAEFAVKLGMKRVALSLTHTDQQAMAQVILED